MRISLVKALVEKERIIDKLSSKLSRDERRRAEADPHARRKPRPCGLTIHTGIGCSYGCIYCYVPDMGFPMRPKPYPLSGWQLAYAVAINPYVAVGKHGTPLALGSVTEPFLEETLGRSMEYIGVLRRILGNPVQLSTKAYISRRLAAEVKKLAGTMSILVSATTMRLAGILEPGAPSPAARMRGLRNAVEAGLHAALFLRPIIPGVTDKELGELLAEAAENKALGVVPGSLRVTLGILRRLEAAGIDTAPIKARLVRMPRGPRDQAPVNTSSIKRKVAREAARLGLRIYPAACSATMDAYKLGCSACRLGPCGEPPEIDGDEIPVFAEMLGVRIRGMSVEDGRIVLVAEGGEKQLLRTRMLLEALAKRRVLISLAH